MIRGIWDGDTWHVHPAPKPKKRGFWSEDIDELARRVVYGVEIKGIERFSVAQRIVREYPYSEAALKMRYVLMNYYENGERRALPLVGEAELVYLKGMLKHHPNSPRVLSDLALKLSASSPEESIAFGQKLLRIDPSNIDAHNALGRAYQRLGDYKTALVHLKTGLKLSDPDEYSYIDFVVDEDTVTGNNYQWFAYDISMIEAGTPRYGPDPEPVSASSSDPLLPFDAESVSPSDSLSDPRFDIPDFPVVDDAVVDPDVPSLRESVAVRAREAMDAARADYEQQQQQEVESFLRWMDQIEHAQSPEDLDDFLMRELATQLRGDVSAFTPERLIRAYETMHKHGEAAGMRELEKLDAELAREMLRHQPKNKVPPRPQNTPPNRKK